MTINNVTRMLDARKIPYTTFDLPPEKLGALETSDLLGIPLRLIYKTIVITRERGKPLLVVVPGDRDVDLKALARILGEKKVSLPTEREAERLTGLQAGGISPLALLNRGFQVVMDSSARDQEQIHVSGGQRGLNICLPVQALIDLTHAQVASICLQV